MTNEDTDTATSKVNTVARSNHVYFYADITPETSAELMRALRDRSVELLTESLTRGTRTPPIWLHVYSLGGDVASALGLADQIAVLGNNVHSIVEGVAASGGGVLAMACHKRYITPRSVIMIHQLSGWIGGTFEDHKSGLELDEILMKNVTDFYVEHSKLTRDRIEEMLKRDTWLSAQQAVEHGFMDAIWRGYADDSI